LFGGHIGERAGDEFGRLGRLPFARQTRGDAEPGEPRLPVSAVHQDIGRLDVLVDEAALVRLAQRRGDADGEAQEASRLHRRADEPLEWFAAWILEQQRCSTAFADKRERPRRPCGVELVPQCVFVGEAFEGRGQRALGGGQHDQHGAVAAVAVLATPPVEDAFAIHPQKLEAVLSLSAERKRLLQRRSVGQAAHSRSTPSTQPLL